MKIIKTFLLLMGIVCYAQAASFTPRGLYSENIIEELNVFDSEKAITVTTLNLQDHPLIFASDQYIFDYEIADTVIKKIIDVFPNLEILDLSLNRLHEHVLPSFIPLLVNPRFKFLDIRINSGANSINGLKELGEAIDRIEPRVSTGQEILMLRKIIWLSEDFIPRVNIPETYKDAHKEYFSKKLTDISSTGWKFPG